MSKVQQTDAQKKEARKQQAMRMTVTKVKPVVVKHILNNQVMDIYDIKVTPETLNIFRLICLKSICPRLSGTERLYPKCSQALPTELPHLTSRVQGNSQVECTITTRSHKRKTKICSKS